MVFSSAEIDQKLNELLSENDPAKKLRAAESILQDAAENHYELGTAAAYVAQGYALWQMSQFPEAITALDKSAALLVHLPDCSWHVWQYIIYGNIYRDIGIYEQGLKNFLSAQKTAKEIRDETLVIKADGNIGNIALSRGDYQSAIEAYKNVLKLTEGTALHQARTTAHANLAAAYYYAGEYQSAADTAQAALRLATEVHDLISAHGNLGIAHVGLDNYEQAKYHLEKSLELAKEARLRLDQCVCQVDLADYHIKVGEDERAIELLQEGLELAQSIDFKSGVRDCHQRLHSLFRKQENWKRALFHHEQLHIVDKSMFNENSEARMRNLEALYKVEQLREINELQQREIEERKKMEKALEELAMTDPLTGLFNRRHFFNVAEFVLKEAIRYHHPLSIMILDIDHFKEVNDMHGHAVGDEAIKVLAGTIESIKRAVDVAARFGGDEFVILMPETNIEQAVKFAQRLKNSLAEKTIPADQFRFRFTLSVGVAGISESAASIDILLEHADQALYAAKQNGRNQARAYLPNTGELNERL